jgi:hypothetical protein
LLPPAGNNLIIKPETTIRTEDTGTVELQHTNVNTWKKKRSHQAQIMLLVPSHIGTSQQAGDGINPDTPVSRTNQCKER